MGAKSKKKLAAPAILILASMGVACVVLLGITLKILELQTRISTSTPVTANVGVNNSSTPTQFKPKPTPNVIFKDGQSVYRSSEFGYQIGFPTGWEIHEMGYTPGLIVQVAPNIKDSEEALVIVVYDSQEEYERPHKQGADDTMTPLQIKRYAPSGQLVVATENTGIGYDPKTGKSFSRLSRSYSFQFGKAWVSLGYFPPLEAYSSPSQLERSWQRLDEALRTFTWYKS